MSTTMHRSTAVVQIADEAVLIARAVNDPIRRLLQAVGEVTTEGKHPLRLQLITGSSGNMQLVIHPLNYYTSPSMRVLIDADVDVRGSAAVELAMPIRFHQPSDEDFEQAALGLAELRAKLS